MPLRIRALCRRAQLERELDDELRDHIERRIAADVARGLTPADARYAAIRAMGGIEQRKEVVAMPEARRSPTLSVRTSATPG